HALRSGATLQLPAHRGSMQGDRQMLLEVEGMRCAKCSEKIHQALTIADPTAKVEVDLDSGRVRVEGVLGMEQAIAALHGAGYAAKGARPHSGEGSDCCGGCS